MTSVSSVGLNYPHRVKIGNDSGLYMGNGRFICSGETSRDVVATLPRKPAPSVTTEQLASAERHLDATVRVARASRVPARTRDVQRVLRAAEALLGRLLGASSKMLPEDITLKDAIHDYKRAEKRRKTKK